MDAKAFRAAVDDAADWVDVYPNGVKRADLAAAATSSAAPVSRAEWRRLLERIVSGVNVFLTRTKSEGMLAL